MATQIFLLFTPLWGRWFPFWRAYFSNGLVQPPTSLKRNVTRISLKNGIWSYHSPFYSHGLSQFWARNSRRRWALRWRKDMWQESPTGWRLSEWVFSVMTWWWQSVMEVFLWVIYMNIRYILVNVLGCSLFIVFGGLILYQVSNQFRTSSRLVCAVISMNTEKLPRNTTPLEKLGKGPGVQDDRKFFGYPKVEMSIFSEMDSATVVSTS